MKGEPKWGRRSILQLTWVYDEYFVRPAVWTSVFEPLGVSCRSVTNRRGAELGTVVQLVVEEEVPLVPAGLPTETCAVCRRVKYLPVQRGPIPPPAVEPTRAMARTTEYFGSGGKAFHEVIVAPSVRRAFGEYQVRGASFDRVAMSVDEVVASVVREQG
jgi:hypothetical protein